MRDRFSDEDVNRVRLALGRIARRVDRQSSSEDGITRSQFSILSVVARRGPIGVRELAEIEGLNPTMVSRMVSKLEEAGLMVRSADLDDKRVISVAATDTGSELFQRLRAKRTALFADRLALLSVEDADRLLDALPALESLAEQMIRPE